MNLHHTKKRAKGVSSSLVHGKLTHSHYKNVVETKNPIFLEHTNFISKRLEIFTQTFTKKSITCIDLKRRWGKVNSVPFGYPVHDVNKPDKLQFDIE